MLGFSYKSFKNKQIKCNLYSSICVKLFILEYILSYFGYKIYYLAHCLSKALFSKFK